MLSSLVIGSFLALIPVYFMIDNEHIGRKLILLVSYIAVAVFAFAIFLLQQSFLYAGVLLLIFFIRITFQGTNVLVMESYLTMHRSLGAA